MTSRIEPAEKKKLEKLKREWGLRSLNDVIARLLSMHDNAPASDGSDSDSGGGPMDEDEPAPIRQFLSFDAIKEELKAVKFFTGLRSESLSWVKKALKDAVRLKLIFCVVIVRVKNGPLCALFLLFYLRL
jgi:hypothetical protein